MDHHWAPIHLAPCSRQSIVLHRGIDQLQCGRNQHLPAAKQQVQKVEE